jgi:uncharacterized metal-binding protein
VSFLNDGIVDSPASYIEPPRAKGAPWLVLVLGFLAVAVAFISKIFVAPSGDLAWLGHLGYWILSLLVFLIPVAIFSIVDLKRQLNLDYPSNSKSVKRMKSLFLLLGLGFSLVSVYQLASELARVLNVV